ncbi:hypothetical protein ABW21_db0209693 [Orbilia brochopaga]|nr:hypothetical protein ABW21_db0209693 [Drechslerella brochopaga]
MKPEAGLPYQLLSAHEISGLTFQHQLLPPRMQAPRNQRCRGRTEVDGSRGRGQRSEQEKETCMAACTLHIGCTALTDTLQIKRQSRKGTAADAPVHVEVTYIECIPSCTYMCAYAQLTCAVVPASSTTRAAHLVPWTACRATGLHLESFGHRIYPDPVRPGVSFHGSSSRHSPVDG